MVSRFLKSSHTQRPRRFALLIMTNTKIVLLSQLFEIGLTTELMGVSLVFGHFNAVHPGHIRYFHTARNYGDRLVVALEGDEQLPEIERRVGFSENERAQALAELDVIDKIIIL